MNPRLQILFDRLETDRLQLRQKLDLLSNEQFNYAPPLRWSVHQILSHLIIAEKMSVQYMKKKTLGINDAGNSGAIEEAKMIMLWLSQRLPFKFKAPRAVVEVTPVYSGIAELMADWERERRELKLFLETFNDDQLKRKIYKHIRAGRLNIQHAVLFFREHYLHHLPQIKRLIQS